MTISNTELIEIARHSSQSIDAVVRVYRGYGSTRARERTKLSASILGLDDPPDPDEGDETRELNFDEVA